MSTTIGIIGTGTIAEAVVIGLCTKADPPEKIVVSPRNQHRAEQLAERFSNVEIARDNQAVISSSDLIFLAVRPQIVEEVFQELAFTVEQRVVSFVSGYSIKQLEVLVEPAKQIVRMIPLPAIARHQGPILLSPPSAEIAELFQELGSLVQVEQEQQLETLCAVTALMAPYFGLLDQCSGWLTANGVDDSKAFDFVAALFDALGRTPSVSTSRDFARLAKQHATPQGFNEQALRELSKLGWQEDVSAVLDLLRRRLEGKAGFDDGVQP